MPSERTEDITPHTDRFSGVVRVLRGGPQHKRPAALLVVAVLIAAGFAAALGAGYTSAKPKYDSASTDLARGYTIVHINGVSGQTEATYRKALARAGQSLSIDQLPNGSVAVTNRSTRVVYVIDGASFALGRTLPGRVPGSTGAPSTPTVPSTTDSPGTTPTGDAPTSPAVDGTPTVVVSGDTSWLVYVGGRQVFRLDPRSNAPTQGVDVGHTIGAAAAGDGGALVVLGTDGAVIVVDPDGHHREQNPGGAKDGAVTRVGDRTYVITTDGTVLRVDSDEIRRVASTGLRSEHPVVGAAGSKILQVDGDTGTLVIVDPVTEEPISVPLGVSGRLGAPVEFGGRVYVPVHGPPHKLIVVDASTGSKLDTIDVPGSSPTFTLKVDGGRLWANDQFDQRAVVIGRDGGDQVIDKGAGPGTTDSSKKPGNKPTKPKPGATPPVNRPPVNVPTTPPATTPPRTGSPTTRPVQPTGPPPVQKVQVPTVRNGTPWQDACAAIQAVGQLKCNANPGGTDHDEDSGTVYDVNPRSGSAVAVGSTVNVSYVGQLKVPNETGQEHAAACTDVQDKGLTCKEKTDAVPAASLDQYGKVSAQNPQAGSDIDKKDDVTLTWRDKIAMPDVTGKDANQACQAFRDQYRVTCQGVEGSPGINGKTPGTVEKTDPTPGATLTDGKSAVTITYYSGSNDLPNYVGQQQQPASTDCQSRGFACTPVEGDTAPDATQIGMVYQQDPGGPTRPSIGTAVTLRFYSGNTTVPDVRTQGYAQGANNQACDSLGGAKLTCAPQVRDGKRVAPNVVQDQSPAPGSRVPIGTQVTIYWTPAAPSVGLDSYKTPTQLLATGGAGGLGDVYTSYPPGGARPIHLYQCPVDDTCSTGDHTYYSVAGNVKTEYVDKGVQFYVLPPDGGGACGAGQKGLWRIWTDTPGNGRTQRNYTYSNAPGPQNYTELLGCVWA